MTNKHRHWDFYTGWILCLFVFIGCGSDTKRRGASLEEQQRKALAISNPTDRATRLVNVARRQSKAGDRRGAQISLDAAAGASEEIENPVVRAEVMNKLAADLLTMNEKSQAKKMLTGVRNAVKKMDNPAAKAKAYAVMAVTQSKHDGRQSAAKNYLKQAEQFAAKAPLPQRAIALGSLSAAYGLLQMSDDAQRISEQALAEAEKIDDARKKTDALADIGLALSHPATEESNKAFAAAEKAAAEIASAESRAYALVYLATRQKSAGNRDAAEKNLQQARTLADKVDLSMRPSLLERIKKAK